MQRFCGYLSIRECSSHLIGSASFYREGAARQLTMAVTGYCTYWKSVSATSPRQSRAARYRSGLAARTLIVFLGIAAPRFLQAQPQTTVIETGKAPDSPIDYEAVRLDKIATAIRISETITLDGHLGEPAWTVAIPATDFLQKFPSHGAPASERTEVRFLYDDDNLYVGVICFDSEPTHMVVKELKEDFDMTGTDLIQIIIDSLHDRRSGFTF